MSFITLQTITSAVETIGNEVTPISKDGVDDFIKTIICKNKELKEPFYVLDLGIFVSLMEKWKLLLPSITPFYAVKCNPDPALLAAMAALGANFDCASRGEMEAILSLGITPERIVYSNPCKAESHIRYAASIGVNLTTFDSKDELRKIKECHPTSALLIRIKVDDSGAAFQLNKKFGALEDEYEPLLLEAQAQGLTLRGVSFHVGSFSTNPSSFRSAIALSKKVFDLATKLGFEEMNVLDIGGGFTEDLFDEFANVIKSSLKEYFGKNSDLLQIIAEPGRYFAASAFTLATTVIGKRMRGDLREYWINDGVYGSLRANISTDFEMLKFVPFACESNKEDPFCEGGITTTYTSTVFGQTCSSMDVVASERQLPELEVNDWLVFRDRGAYKAVLGTNFNGFSTSTIVTHVVYSTNSNVVL